MVLHVIENIIRNLNVTLSSKNRGILKRVDKYDAQRADVSRRENLASVLAGELEKSSMTEAAALIRDQERRLKEERERLDRLIDELIAKLTPEKDSTNP